MPLLHSIYSQYTHTHTHTYGDVLLYYQDAETPLIKATKMRNIEIVELLLDKGAKVSAVDRVRC